MRLIKGIQPSSQNALINIFAKVVNTTNYKWEEE